MRESSARFTLPLLLVVFLFGCRTSAPSVPRYIVTVTPVDALGGGWGLCIAVDPTDTQGVWWWQPGPSGCASRITGPTVFRADRAHVRVSAISSSISASFTLQLHNGSRDVNLALQDSEMLIADSGMRVPTEHRADLDIPPAYGR
jgi:hypothetical protein